MCTKPLFGPMSCKYKLFEFMVLSSEALAILLRYSVDNNEIANRVKSIDRVKALLFLYMLLSFKIGVIILFRQTFFL